MIKNLANGKTVITKTVEIKSILGKILGLMFRKPPLTYGMIFSFKKSQRLEIHTWFVRYPIDILFLDEHKRIVDMVRNLNPFSSYSSGFDSRYVIELPAGTIEASGCQVTDELEF